MLFVGLHKVTEIFAADIVFLYYNIARLLSYHLRKRDGSDGVFPHWSGDGRQMSPETDVAPVHFSFITAIYLNIPRLKT